MNNGQNGQRERLELLYLIATIIIDSKMSLNCFSYMKVVSVIKDRNPYRLKICDISLIAGEFHDKDIVFYLEGKETVLPKSIANSFCSLINREGFFRDISAVWLPMTIRSFDDTQYQAIGKLIINGWSKDKAITDNSSILFIYLDPYAGLRPCLIVRKSDSSLLSYSCEDQRERLLTMPFFNTDETRCLRHILSGNSTRQIANNNCWSLSKTKQIRSSIIKKLNCHSIIQAIAAIEVFELASIMP